MNVSLFSIYFVFSLLQSDGTTLEQNKKSLNVSTKGNLYEIEAFMPVHFEKGQEEGLMLWQLRTRLDCKNLL